MKLRPGIKLLAEIVGRGDPIADGGRYDAVLKFYRNRGEPLTMNTCHAEPVPRVAGHEGKLRIEWDTTALVDSHVVIERNRVLSRGCDELPGIYYTLLGMRRGGYRHVAILPHLFAHTMHEVLGIDRESVIKLECFLLEIRA